eukprot:5858106-Pyramimonas_sp.AAC.1
MILVRRNTEPPSMASIFAVTFSKRRTSSSRFLARGHDERNVSSEDGYLAPNLMAPTPLGRTQGARGGQRVPRGS